MGVVPQRERTNTLKVIWLTNPRRLPKVWKRETTAAKWSDTDSGEGMPRQVNIVHNGRIITGWAAARVAFDCLWLLSTGTEWRRIHEYDMKWREV